MRSTRLALAVTALSAALALSACSGDDGNEPDTDASNSSSPSASEDGGLVDAPGCEVEVKATGKPAVAWTGEARGSTGDGIAVFQAKDKKNALAVYGKTEDKPALAYLTVQGVTYTAEGKGIDVAKDGTTASVDAKTTGPAGKGPRLVATFTCDEAES